MPDIQQYKEKLQQYKTRLNEAEAQLEGHDFVNLNFIRHHSLESVKELQARGEIQWLSVREVRQQLKSLNEDSSFFTKIYNDLDKYRILLQKEADPTQPTNWLGVLGEAASVFIAGAAVQATSQKRVYVKGYRKKDGTYVKGYDKNVKTEASEGAKKALSNSLENVGSHRNNSSEEEKFLGEKEQLLRERDQLIHEYSALMNKINSRILNISTETQLAESYVAHPQQFQQKYIEDRIREEEEAIRAKEQAAIQAEKDRIAQEKALIVGRKFAGVVSFLIFFLSPVVLLAFLYLYKASLIMAILQTTAIIVPLIIIAFIVAVLNS
jgi:hypothetical protein